MSIPQTPSPLSNIIAAKTYNAAWFSGSTKEAQITAAIAAAVLDGALYVYIPANMFGYIAASVTFNTSIKMIREGGNPEAFDVMAYGAIGDHATDCRAAFLAADLGAAFYNNAAIYVPTATRDYILASNTTISSPIIFGYGAQVSPAVSTTFTMNGTLTGPTNFQIFGGSGSIRVATGTTPVLYAEWFASGTDIGVWINSAISAFQVGTAPNAQRGPGTIKVLQSGNFATAIDLRDSNNIRITSDHGNMNVPTDFGPTLHWTGGAGSGAAVLAMGSTGLEWDHISLDYTNVAYNGSLFSLSSVGSGFWRGAVNTGLAHIHHCRISGTNTARLARRLVELNVSLNIQIDNCSLDFAIDGIGSSGAASAAIVIGPNVWFNANFTGKQVGVWGHSYTLLGVTAESLPTGASNTPFIMLDGDSTALKIWAGFIGDGPGAGGGTLIDLDTGGFACTGFECQTMIAQATGTGIKLSNTAGKTTGVSITGSRIDMGVGAGTVGVHLGRANGIQINGNKLRAALPWTGTEPTRYNVSNNDLDVNAAAVGIVIANGASVAITPPGSANDGAGLISIFCPEDASSAMFYLNGGAGTTFEISDFPGLYTNTVGTAASINVYYDGGTSSYRIQNNRGLGNRTIIVTYLGR